VERRNVLFRTRVRYSLLAISQILFIDYFFIPGADFYFGHGNLLLCYRLKLPG
jgi:hypothetical protein